MCLEAIDRVWDIPYRRTKFAWKVFELEDGRLYGPYHHRNTAYALSEWHKATDETIRTPPIPGIPRLTYPSGFHSFELEKDAIAMANAIVPTNKEGRMVALKVKIRDILVKGFDGVGGKDPVFVSRYMYIPRPVGGLKNL
jgi:hypothetical protein